MANYLHDEAICLRVLDFSETSQIVDMFTRRHGIVPLIAKGSKGSSKRHVMSGPLDLLTCGQVVFVPARGTQGRPGDGGTGHLGLLTAWQLTDHRPLLRTSLAAINAAMMAAEVTAHLLKPHDPCENLYLELDAALGLLGRLGSDAHGTRALVACVKAVLVATGFWPNLAHCLACRRPVSDAPMRFSPRAGGVLCATAAPGRIGATACHVEDAGATLAVPGRILIALERLASPRELSRGPAGNPALQRRADAAALLAALHLLLAHVEALTDRPLRTRAVLPTIFDA